MSFKRVISVVLACTLVLCAAVSVYAYPTMVTLSFNGKTANGELSVPSSENPAEAATYTSYSGCSVTVSIQGVGICDGVTFQRGNGGGGSYTAATYIYPESGGRWQHVTATHYATDGADSDKSYTYWP